MIEFPTEEELAVTQAAIGDAYDGWVADVEDAVQYRPPAHDQASEVPAFSELMSADTAQLSDLDERLRKASGG